MRGPGPYLARNCWSVFTASVSTPIGSAIAMTARRRIVGPFARFGAMTRESTFSVSATDAVGSRFAAASPARVLVMDAAAASESPKPTAQAITAGFSSLSSTKGSAEVAAPATTSSVRCAFHRDDLRHAKFVARQQSVAELPQSDCGHEPSEAWAGPEQAGKGESKGGSGEIKERMSASGHSHGKNPWADWLRRREAVLARVRAGRARSSGVSGATTVRDLPCQCTRVRRRPESGSS